MKGHYHNLGSNVMAEIPKKLENPVLMIRLGNGRINEIVQLNDKKGNPVLVSLELSAIKNLGGSFNAYNLVVTAFGAKSNYINNLVSNPDNTVLINNLPGETSQVNPRRNELPGVINEATSGSYTTSATTPGVITDNSANTFTSETAEPVARGDTSSLPSVNAEAPRVTSETAAAKPSVSNDISSDTSIPTDTQNVNGKFEGGYRSDLGNGTRTTQTVETINNADMTTDARRLL